MTYEGNCTKCGAIIERVGNRQPNIKIWVCFDCKNLNQQRHTAKHAIADKKKRAEFNYARTINAELKVLNRQKKKIEMRIEILTGRLPKI